MSARDQEWRNVPPHERCFGVTKNSKTRSLVPMMSGKDVSAKPDDDDYDVVVAMHNYGKGSIAYFGDVNAEDETLWLVSAFLESRSPKHPIDCFSGIDNATFSTIMQLKEEGNNFFKNGELDQAIPCYQSALDEFGTKLGSNGPQKETYVNILSNLSLVYLKQEDYLQAENTASKALELEWGHNKCSYRRALARLKISQSTPSGDLKRLRQAMKDVLNADPGNATKILLLQVEVEIKKVEKRERNHFSAGFAAAMTGRLN